MLVPINKYKYKLTSSLLFPPSTVVLPALFNFFIVVKYLSEVSQMFFTFLREKRYLNYSPFSLNVCEATCKARTLQAASNFGTKLTHLCGFWLDISIFLIHEKTFFVILIGHIDFFTCEKHRLLFWLARTDLCMEIYINDNLVCLWVSQYQGFW